MGNLTLKLLVTIALLGASRTFGEDDPILKDPWVKVSRGFPDEAIAAFKEILPGSPEGREAVYGHAVALLIKQPMTRGNISESARLFQTVIDASSSDELGVTARYFLGRIEEIYRFEPDRAKAISIYSALFHDHPDNPVAQRAFVKVVLLELYDQIPDSERAARFAQFEANGSELSDHDAVRDFHLLMAAACDKFGYGKQKRLEHLLAVDAVGVAKADTKANLLVSIAELARELGRNDLALKYYHRFLSECLRDYRSYTVEQRIAELEQAPK